MEDTAINQASLLAKYKIKDFICRGQFGMESLTYLRLYIQNSNLLSEKSTNKIREIVKEQGIDPDSILDLLSSVDSDKMQKIAQIQETINNNNKVLLDENIPEEEKKQLKELTIELQEEANNLNFALLTANPEALRKLLGTKTSVTLSEEEDKNSKILNDLSFKFLLNFFKSHRKDQAEIDEIINYEITQKDFIDIAVLVCQDPENAMTPDAVNFMMSMRSWSN